MNANVDGMNKPSPTSGSNTPSANDSDQDFDPSAEMLINDFDDEHTLEEEEANDDCSNITNEISDLKKEGEMPIEELLVLYGYQQSGNKTDKSQESSQRTSTNHGDNNDNVKESNYHEDTTANASQDPQVNQTSTPTGTYTTTTTTRSSKHLEELSSQWSLPPTTTPLTNTNLLIDQECSDMEDDDEEEDDEDEDEDDDGDDDEEGEGDWRRTIQVGSDYQAVIPEGLNGYGNVPPYENEDKLLWDAYVLTEDIVVNFLRQISSFDTTESSDSLSSPSGTNKSSDPTSAPSSTSSTTQSIPLRETTNLPMTSSIRDDEVALYLLHQCGHNVEEALRRKRMQQNNPFETMSPWSEEECINFEDGIRVYGKDFHQIQKNKVSTRSVGELVQFYYLWKKTERHDMYASKWRVEKKKYSLHPGTTDYMDRFIDEQENLALQAHSMNISTSNYTRHQSHGSYSMIHYNHNSSSGNFSGGQQSSNATIPASTKETVSSDNVIDSSVSHQSNGSTNLSGLSTGKSNNCSTSTANTTSTTTVASSIQLSSSTALSSSSTTNTTTTATNNLTPSSSSNNGPETLNSNVSGTINESLNSGISRENVQNNSSNSNPSKTTSATDLFSPLTKMRMNIVDR